LAPGQRTQSGRWNAVCSQNVSVGLAPGPWVPVTSYGSARRRFERPDRRTHRHGCGLVGGGNAAASPGAYPFTGHHPESVGTGPIWGGRAHSPPRDSTRAKKKPRPPTGLTPAIPGSPPTRRPGKPPYVPWAATGGSCAVHHETSGVTVGLDGLQAVVCGRAKLRPALGDWKKTRHAAARPTLATDASELETVEGVIRPVHRRRGNEATCGTCTSSDSQRRYSTPAGATRCWRKLAERGVGAGGCGVTYPFQST